VLDHFDRAPQVVPRLAVWMEEGKLRAQETVVDGFEHLPVAINMLFDGKNTGKLVVKL
jgi:NADPH-dependent curcumin reductase CurA